MHVDYLRVHDISHCPVCSFDLIVTHRRFQASLEVRQAGRRAVSTLGGTAMSRDTVVILHFNDVYNIEETTSKTL